MTILIPPKLEGKSMPNEKLILLIAAIERKGKLYSLVNFDEMAAQSDGQFSATSLEHTFRDYKQAAQALNKISPIGAGSVPKSTSRKRKASDVSTADTGNEETSMITTAPRTKATPRARKQRQDKPVIKEERVEDGDEVAV